MSHPGHNTFPSDEVLGYHLQEVLLAEDWEIRFSVNGAGMRAINGALKSATNLAERKDLLALKQEALERTLGAGAIELFKRGVLAERQNFNERFGS